MVTVEHVTVMRDSFIVDTSLTWRPRFHGGLRNCQGSSTGLHVVASTDEHSQTAQLGHPTRSQGHSLPEVNWVEPPCGWAEASYTDSNVDDVNR